MGHPFRRVASLLGGVAIAAGLTLTPTAAASSDPIWPQWGQNPQHQGFVDEEGQSLDGILADKLFDPFVRLEQQDNDGDLLVHYQVPLLDGQDVFMEFKTGRYIACDPVTGNPPPGEKFCGSDAWNNQIWNQRRLHWEGGKLVEKWNYQSGWKPEPDGGGLGGWEPVYHAALANGFVYDPEFGGRIVKLNRGNGSVVSMINPFATVDPGTFVAGPLSADEEGNVYYNVLKLNLGADPSLPTPWITDVLGAWLVKVDKHDNVSKVSYKDLVPGAPTGKTCTGVFSTRTLPWPPSPTAKPAQVECGSQRPGVNVAPAIAPDGTIYTVSRAHFVSRVSFVVAVNPDLTPKWAASMRGEKTGLADGCGVLLPIGSDPTTTPQIVIPGACRVGAPIGVDPQTNEKTAGRVIDQSSSSPTVAPDGSVLYGAYSRYNFARGHLFRFSAGGNFLAAYDFGWDSTPATFSRDDSFSIVIKDNHYDAGSYCNSRKWCPPAPPGPYFITQLDPNLTPEWKFKNTETKSCTRKPDGTLSCVTDHPNGFEWCINAPAIDENGVVFANSEDGNLYAINQGGTLKQRLFLNLAIGAAYTPLSIGGDGKIYTENDGHLFVVGNLGMEVEHEGGHGNIKESRGTRHVDTEDRNSD